MLCECFVGLLANPRPRRRRRRDAPSPEPEADPVVVDALEIAEVGDPPDPPESPAASDLTFATTPTRRGRPSRRTLAERKVRFKALAGGGKTAREDYLRGARSASREKKWRNARNPAEGMDLDDEEFEDAKEEEEEEEGLGEPPQVHRFDDIDQRERDEEEQTSTSKDDSTFTKIDKVIDDYSHVVTAEYEALRQGGVLRDDDAATPNDEELRQGAVFGGRANTFHYDEDDDEEDAKPPAVDNTANAPAPAQTPNQYDSYWAHEGNAHIRQALNADFEERVARGTATATAGPVQPGDENSLSSLSSLFDTKDSLSFQGSVESNSAENIEMEEEG